jgi:hypothetical protein
MTKEDKPLFEGYPDFDSLSVAEKAVKLIEFFAEKAATQSGRYRVEEVHIHTDGYAEPGYSIEEGKSGVIALGNWNAITKWDEKKHDSIVVDQTICLLADEFEKLGIEMDWDDEWGYCSKCGKLFRVTQDSYRWQRYYWDCEDGDPICGDCVLEDPTEYLVSFEGKDNSCITIEIDLEKCGYIKLEGGFENGFYDGQDADPKLIAAELRHQDIERFIFNLDGVGQFDLSFSVYVHKSELKKLNKIKFKDKSYNGPSVSGAMREALKDASSKMGKLPDGKGVKVATISAGKAEVKIVSPQDFIDGKALGEKPKHPNKKKAKGRGKVK